MSVRTTQTFAVPVLYHDVDSPTCLAQVLDAMAHLDKVTKSVFSHIEARCVQERNRMNSITGRIADCEAKVAAIAGATNRSTRVAATAKYPAAEAVQEYHSCFDNLPFVEATSEAPESEEGPIFAAEEDVAVKTAGKAKAMLGLFCALNMKTPREAAKEDVPQEGLGKLPAYLPSVANLMLFNSSQNPYEEYSTVERVLESEAKEEKNDDLGLAAAPSSMLRGDKKAQKQGVTFEFKPKLQDFKGFELPEHIALPNVITDEQWQGDGTEELIAPSMMLPDSSMPAIMDAPGARPGAAPAAAGPPPPPVAGSAGPPPPPTSAGPPPPPTSAGPPPPPTSAGPPPPPVAAAAAPAPAPAAAAPAPAPAAAPAAAPKPKPAGGGMMSMDLLASIRDKKNKTKLKPASKAKKPEIKKPVSIMDELAKRMANRRKVFGGKKTADASAPVRRASMMTPVTVMAAKNKMMSNRKKSKEVAPIVEDVKEGDESDATDATEESGDEAEPEPAAAAPAASGASLLVANLALHRARQRRSSSSSEDSSDSDSD